MEQAGPDDNRLRIARYVDHPPRNAAPGKPAVPWPDIADYWPDAPHRQRADDWRALPPDTAESPPGDEPAERQGSKRPVVLSGALALLVIGGSVLLARPLTDADVRQRRAAPAPILPAESTQIVIPLEPRPAPTTALTTTTVRTSDASTSGVRTSATPAGASLELVTGVGELSVSTSDLGGEDFRVTGPAASSFTGGVLRLSGSDGGSGPVRVQLSERRVWRLRIGAGVKSVAFDLGGGTVSRIDLAGGAERIDITLGRLTGTVPIRMAGGVSTWRIRTAAEVPVRVALGQGAGDVVLYGKHSGGSGAGTTVRSGDLSDEPGLDIDAAAGLGTLEVTSS